MTTTTIIIIITIIFNSNLNLVVILLCNRYMQLNRPPFSDGQTDIPEKITCEADCLLGYFLSVAPQIFKTEVNNDDSSLATSISMRTSLPRRYDSNIG